VSEKSTVTADFVRAAIDNYAPWKLGNDVLYELCATHPYHTEDAVIIGKFWLIGRSYAAAIERRRVSGDREVSEDYRGDDIYTKQLAPTIRRNMIDRWFDALKVVEPVPATALQIHKTLTDLLHRITGMDNRSLVSKYLHFHFPAVYFIYDSRALTSVGELYRQFGGKPLRSAGCDVADLKYAPFWTHCEFVSSKIAVLMERKITPRELDCVLVEWWASNKRKKHRG